jgi:hypothetical protein
LLIASPSESQQSLAIFDAGVNPFQSEQDYHAKKRSRRRSPPVALLE